MGKIINLKVFVKQPIDAEGHFFGVQTSLDRLMNQQDVAINTDLITEISAVLDDEIDRFYTKVGYKGKMYPYYTWERKSDLLKRIKE